jgi:hypothetical protein
LNIATKFLANTDYKTHTSGVQFLFGQKRIMGGLKTRAQNVRNSVLALTNFQRALKLNSQVITTAPLLLGKSDD